MSMPPKTNAKPIKQTAYKQRLAEKGLVRRELWVHPADWPRVQAYAKILANARHSAELYAKQVFEAQGRD